ncbi:hypothetical protein D3C84_994100 [compost metagenome]
MALLVDVGALALAHSRHGVSVMRSVIASLVVLALTAMLAVQVGTAVSASIGKLTDAMSLSSRSMPK